MAALALALSPDGGYPALLPGVLLVSLGQGVAWTAMFAAAATGVDARHQGVASAMASTTQQVGGAVGLAVLVAVASAGPDVATGPALVPGLRAAGFTAALLTLAGVGIALTLRRPAPAAAPGTAVPDRAAA
ncbi:MFS transporter, partial [Actinomadura kijaniata]